jgi:hypothetical protein
MGKKGATDIGRTGPLESQHVNRCKSTMKLIDESASAGLTLACSPWLRGRRSDAAQWASSSARVA